MAQTITLNLPDDAWQRYRQSAQAAGKDLEDFLTDRLREAIPPSSSDLPLEVQQELQTLEQLDDTALEEVALSQLPNSEQQHYERLLAKQAEESITVDERLQLEAVAEQARRLTLKKGNRSQEVRGVRHIFQPPHFTQHERFQAEK